MSPGNYLCLLIKMIYERNMKWALIEGNVTLRVCYRSDRSSTTPTQEKKIHQQLESTKNKYSQSNYGLRMLSALRLLLAQHKLQVRKYENVKHDTCEWKIHSTLDSDSLTPEPKPQSESESESEAESHSGKQTLKSSV